MKIKRWEWGKNIDLVSGWLSGRWWWYTLVQYLQYGENVTLALYNLSLVTPYCHAFNIASSGVTIYMYKTIIMAYKRKEFTAHDGNPRRRNRSVMRGEHKDTYVYKGKNVSERIVDLEDRISFIKEDMEMNSPNGPTKAQQRSLARLQKDLAALRAQKASKK